MYLGECADFLTMLILDACIKENRMVHEQNFVTTSNLRENGIDILIPNIPILCQCKIWLDIIITQFNHQFCAEFVIYCSSNDKT